MMKKVLVLIIGFTLLCGLAISAQAAEGGTAATNTATTETGPIPGEQGQFILQGGTVWNSEGYIHLSKYFALTEVYKDDTLKLGVRYEPSDSFWVNAGVRYDTLDHSSVPFGRIDAKIPFGDNLKIVGYAAQNYFGVDWTSYEWAIQIEVFNNMFIYTGVRGEFGNTVPIYSYNQSNDPYLFLRGDFNWKAGNFGFSIQPYLYICGEGVWFHNYTIRYNASKNMAISLNSNTLFDQKPKFLLGVEWKF
jgi:hypothetical protein